MSMARHEKGDPDLMRPSRDNSAGSGMRRRIKQAATDLLIRKGFRGASYGDIASALGITTTNIHYHFGPKKKLVEEVVRDYVDSALARHRKIWQDPETSLAEKLDGVVVFNAERHRRFNRGGVGGRPWSLIGRLRLESDLLSPRARDALADFSIHVHEYVLAAVNAARDKGELQPDSPVEDIAFLMTSIVNTSSTFTQEVGSIERLAAYFRTVSRVLTSAYACARPVADCRSSRRRTPVVRQIVGSR
jgi:TetR/AcrR family transcriptional repressor of nem operon